MLKKINTASIKYLYGSLLVFLLLSASTVSAMEQYPYFDPQQGYGIKDDASPWFDGKDYPFFREMYDGKSLKPQEEGSYQKFPKSSVPVRVVLGKVVKIYDPFIPAVAGDGSGVKGNPREFSSPASIQYNAGKHFITLTVQHVMVRMVSHRLW